MLKTLKKKLKKIQNSDEATKKRWVIGATIVTIIAVIAFWFIYIDWTVKSIGQEEIQGPSTGAWQIFKNGLIVFVDSIKEIIKNFISKIYSEKTIIIKP